MDLDALQATTKGMFPSVLGMRFVGASKEEIRGELVVREDLCTTPGIMHGGAIMAFADTLGAYGAVLNLPAGARTTTIESKTNFFAAAPGGATLTGVSVPLHRGGRTMVWQTRMTRPDGRLVAMVTQTQAVLQAEPPIEERLAQAFSTGSVSEQQARLASLERAGAGIYRRWAEDETDPETKAVLLAAAEREDENAAALDALTRTRTD